MSLEFEKDFDDEVYEDSFYSEDEELKEEELDTDDEQKDDEEDTEESDELEEDNSLADDDITSATRVDVSFVCDDCDYRWDDSMVQNRNEFEEAEEITDAVCPMCGSMNVTQI